MGRADGTAIRTMVRSFGVAATCIELERYKPRAHADVALVRMISSPINPSDLLTINGTYASRVSFPFHPGFEGVGTVAKCPVDHSKLIGRRVVPIHIAGAGQEFRPCDPRRCVPG